MIYGSKVAQGGGSSVATGMFIAALFATPLGASHFIHILIVIRFFYMFTYGDARECYSIYIRYDCHEKLHPRVLGFY